MKNNEIRDEIGADTISKRDGVYTVRKGFFYRHGQTSKTFANQVKTAFPNAEIIEHSEHWASFRGGATVANSSHWWVKFKMEAE